MKLDFHKEAEFELYAIIDHYTSINADLGNRFTNHFWSSIHKILDNPLLFERVDNNLRKHKMVKFPYIIIYEIFVDKIEIMLIKHEKRDPTYGFDRR